MKTRLVVLVSALCFCAVSLFASAPQQRQDPGTPANAAVQAAVDAQGNLRQPTAAEQQALAAAANARPSIMRLPMVHANGMVSIALDESSDHLLVIRTDADGNLSLTCTDDHDEAARFTAAAASIDTIVRIQPGRKSLQAERE
jgi:hypothetical protein